MLFEVTSCSFLWLWVIPCYHHGSSLRKINMKPLVIQSTQVGISKIHSLLPGCSLQFLFFLPRLLVFVQCTPGRLGTKSITFSILILEKNRVKFSSVSKGNKFTTKYLALIIKTINLNRCVHFQIKITTMCLLYPGKGLAM